MSTNTARQVLTLGFKRLEVLCFIGVFPYEKQIAQKIYISLNVVLGSIVNNDLLTSTIDYSILAEICREVSLQRPRELIETLAQDILDTVFARMHVLKAKIAIEKPLALHKAECAFVELERSNEGEICVGH